jgi:hypothetical protein
MIPREEKPAMDDSEAFAARVAAALDHVQNALAALALDAPLLTPKERMEGRKWRKGGEAVIPRIATLAEQYNLEVPRRSTRAMLAALERVKEVDALHKEVGTLLKTIEDAMFVDRGDAWGTATTLYSMLKRLARNDGEVKEALVDVEAFFAYRHPSVAAATGEAPSAAVEAEKAHGRA